MIHLKNHLNSCNSHIQQQYLCPYGNGAPCPPSNTSCTLKSQTTVCSIGELKDW
jgi:hypothetical protein